MEEGQNWTLDHDMLEIEVSSRPRSGRQSGWDEFRTLGPKIGLPTLGLEEARGSHFAGKLPRDIQDGLPLFCSRR